MRARPAAVLAACGQLSPTIPTIMEECSPSSPLSPPTPQLSLSISSSPRQRGSKRSPRPPRTPPRKSVPRPSKKPLKKSPARSSRMELDTHGVTTWEIALLLTDPGTVLLVDIRDSFLLFLPHYTKAVVLLQHLLDLFYGAQQPTGHIPSDEMLVSVNKQLQDKTSPLYIRRRKILSFFVKWVKGEFGQQDIVKNKEACNLLTHFCTLEAGRKEACMITKALTKVILTVLRGGSLSVSAPQLPYGTPPKPRSARAASASVDLSKRKTSGRKTSGSSKPLLHRSSTTTPKKKPSFFKRAFSSRKIRSTSDPTGRKRTLSADRGSFGRRKSAPKKIKEITQIQALSVAHELTAGDYEMTRQIKYREMSDQQWKSKRKKDLAPHVLEVIDKYNLRTHWVVSMMFHNRLVKRNPIGFFLELAKHLLELRNFNCLSQIVAGLGHELASPSRLPEIWNALTKQQMDRYQRLKALCAPTNGYAQYRKMIQSLRQQKVRVIPMFNVLLQDLYTIQDRVPWTLKPAAAASSATPSATPATSATSATAEAETTVNTMKLFQLYDIIHTNLSDCRSQQFASFESYPTVRDSLDKSLADVTMNFGEIAKMARDNKKQVKHSANKLLSALGDTGLL